MQLKEDKKYEFGQQRHASFSRFVPTSPFVRLWSDLYHGFRLDEDWRVEFLGVLFGAAADPKILKKIFRTVYVFLIFQQGAVPVKAVVSHVMASTCRTAK